MQSSSGASIRACTRPSPIQHGTSTLITIIIIVMVMMSTQYDSACLYENKKIPNNRETIVTFPRL
jgi:hypothetical protein